MQTTIIEKYLQAIDQATFQKMINHLLYLEGYKFIGSPGSVIGKNKTSKGSPDSFFEDGEDFVFCEVTTKERLDRNESFFTKLKKDVAHCFNSKVTGIEKASVSKVILAFTDEIKPVEFKKLKDLVKSYNLAAELIVYSIQEIPFRILYYPGFAEKYIAGIKTTKGTLYTLPDFVSASTKGIQPSLINEFVGREDEIKAIKDILSNNDVLIISGSAGVGKSKLAIHVAELLEAEQGFEPRVIVSSPVPLWDDLQTFLIQNKKYCVVFDDANKALPNLDYLLQFVQNRDIGTTIVIITVRDYVRAELDKIVLDKRFADLTLNTLSDEKIKEIIEKILPKGNNIDPFVMERILSLSKGNSRLALMATKLIIENNNADVLKNVVSLYEEYFKKIQSEIAFLNKPKYLKALGILSFFGVLDRNDEELKKSLQVNFGINWDEIWEIYIELEQYELVDVFFKESAKISDQIFTTFIFYKAFIEVSSTVINYSNWIECFITSFDKKINKSLIDTINTFGFNELKDRLITLIIEVENKIENDEDLSYKFYSIFWFYREVNTFQFINKWIDNLEYEEIEFNNIKFSYRNNEFIWPSNHIGLLQNFWYHNTLFTQQAFELGMKLAFKQPSFIPELLKSLNDNISYHRFDYRDGYNRQHNFFDVLLKDDYSIRQQFIADHIFLEKAGDFLGWDYTQIEGRGGGQMVIYNFTIVKNNSLMLLRDKVLKKLFSLFSAYEEKVIEILCKYIWGGREFDITIYDNEQAVLSEFFKSNLTPNNYAHCKLIHQYTKELNEHNIKIINDWSEFMDSDSISIAHIFTWTYDEIEGDFSTREKEKEKRIQSFLDGKDIISIENILNHIQHIYNKDTRNESHTISVSLGVMFNYIAEKDIELYLSSLELLMQGKFDFSLYGNFLSFPLKNRLIDSKKIYNHINRYDYKMKQAWKLAFFEMLHKEDIDEFLLHEFVGLIFSLNNDVYFGRLEEFEKFNDLFGIMKSKLPTPALDHNNIITYVADILLSKEKSIRVIFDSSVCQDCYSFFNDKIPLLKKLYFHQSENHHYSYDYDGKELMSVSILDNFFVLEYLIEVTKDKSYIGSRFDNIHLDFVWDFQAYEQILDRAFEILMLKAPIWSNIEHPINILFKGAKTNNYEDKARSYISKFIAINHSSKKHILTIMNVVTYSFTEDILKFYKEYLIFNNTTEIIESLWLERNDVISGGSRVPKIEAHITFVNQIIEMIKGIKNSLDYADLIRHWERKLEWAKKDKQEELKRDFKEFRG